MKDKQFPLVSVVMNCHNGEKFLFESLKSVVSQTYSNWELIFWDNCSTDRSTQILKEFSDKRIKYFYSKKYTKLYAARNLALKKAKGHFISFLDTDDTWHKNKLKKQVELFYKKNCSATYTNYYIKNEKKNFKYLFEKKKLPNGYITQNLLDKYCIGILTAMIKKNVLNQFKFNNRYQIIGDFDFFVRLSQKYKFYCLQEPLAIYRFHGQNLFHLKIGLYLKEMKFWFKKNKSNLKRYNLKNIKFLIFKLEIKNMIRKLF